MKKGKMCQKNENTFGWSWWKYIKIRINWDYDLPLEKTLKMFNVAILKTRKPGGFGTGEQLQSKWRQKCLNINTNLREIYSDHLCFNEKWQNLNMLANLVCTKYNKNVYSL